MLYKLIFTHGIVLLTLAGTAIAADSVIPFKRPGDEREDIMDKEPFKQKKQPRLELPPIQAPDEQDKKLSQQIRIKIEGIQFDGNTVFPDQQLLELNKDYIGKEVDTFALQEIRNNVTKLYINNGYINSGAVIPDQDLNNNILIIKIIEGNLTTVNVSNSGRLNDNYISERVQIPESETLNIGVLQEKLYLLQQDPRIARINANLGPGANRGESILNMEITEARPYSLMLQANNHRPPSVGEEQALLNFSHLNVTGAGDRFNLSISGTEGLEDGSTSYHWPLSHKGNTLDIYYNKSNSEIIEDSIASVFNIENKSETATIGYTHPFYKSSTAEYIAAISLDKRRSTTYLNGDAKTLVGSGCVEGLCQVTALRLTQSMLNQVQNTIYSFRHVISVGLEILDSTQHDDPNIPDSDFTTWLLQFQIAKHFPNWQLQSIFRADAQLAFDELLSMEQFAVGGAYTVRGYRENQLVRDNGFVSSWELRKAVFVSDSSNHIIQITGFADYGRAWSHSDSTDSQNIYSFGAGLRWSWRNHASTEIYWADPQEDIDNPDDESLQDKGLHVNLVVNIL